MWKKNGLYRCGGTVSGLETNLSDRPFWLHTYLSLPVYKCSPVDSQFVSLNYSGLLFSHYDNSISPFPFPFLEQHLLHEVGFTFLLLFFYRFFVISLEHYSIISIFNILFYYYGWWYAIWCSHSDIWVEAVIIGHLLSKRK